MQRVVASTFDKGFAIVLLFILFARSVFGQDQKPEDKIDPFFKVLISQQKQKDAIVPKKTASCTLLKTSKVENIKNASPEQTYECIVYTKNAQALRDRNIIINSELPAFVTALATLRQMQQMSLMPEVTYIENPKTNRLH